MTSTSPPVRTWGFRISWLDAMILLLGTVITCWLIHLSFPLAWIVPAALGSLDWLSPLLFQLPVTILVIIRQLRSP